jgi:MoaA/NifB/PqqE/SkfB family radical SAM enzyme
LKTLALATNGLTPASGYNVFKNVIAAIEGKFDLVVVCSLDGKGVRHDAVRGVSGAYESVRETIEKLKELASGESNFWLGIKSTILPNNLDQIPWLVHFARENGLFHILSPVLFTSQRFRNVERRRELDLLPRFKEDLMGVYSGDDYGDSYYSHVVSETLKLGGRSTPCSAAMDHFFVEGDGTVFPCPVMDAPLGNIQTHSIEDILNSTKRKELARKIGSSGPCRQCLEPGCIRFSQAGEGFSFLKHLLGARGRRNFEEAYWRQGMHKYF